MFENSQNAYTSINYCLQSFLLDVVSRWLKFTELKGGLEKRLLGKNIHFVNTAEEGRLEHCLSQKHEIYILRY